MRGSASIDSGRKEPMSPGCQSTTSTTHGGSSGSTFRITSGLVSSLDANSICLNVLDEIDQDLATIIVTSSSHGCIRGRLQWGHTEVENVAFTVLEMRKGYSVIGEVCEGPDIFRKIPWKLKTVNGCIGVSPVSIARGDRLILDGPRWAMERLAGRRSKRELPKEVTTPTNGNRAKEWSGTCTPPSVSTSPNTLGEETTGASLGESLSLATEGLSAPSPRELEFDIVHAGRSQQPPVVPKLNLVGMQSRYAKPLSKPNLNLLCGANCQLAEAAEAVPAKFGCL